MQFYAWLAMKVPSWRIGNRRQPAEPAALQRGIPLEPAHCWHPSACAAELAREETGDWLPRSLKAHKGDQQPGEGGRKDDVTVFILASPILTLMPLLLNGTRMGIEGPPSRAFRDTWQGPGAQKWRGCKWADNSLVFMWCLQPISEQESELHNKHFTSLNS